MSLTEDEYDDMTFGQIPRLARLQHLLEKLRANEVGVLAGNYVRRSLIDKDAVTPQDLVFPSRDGKRMIKSERRIRVHFVPSGVDEEVITIPVNAVDPDPDDDEIPF